MLSSARTENGINGGEEIDYWGTMALLPPKGSERDRDNQFYGLLAGGARLKLLEAFLDLGIPELLGMNKKLSAKEICSILNLDLTRGWKFLHALHLSGLLSERGGEHGQDSAEYVLSDMAKEFFGHAGDQGYFWRDTVMYWKYLNEMDNVSFVDMLRGAALPPMPVWPPANMDSARHLERWMTVTAEGAAATLLSSQAMHGARTVLDVGGGDGSLAIALLEDGLQRGEELAISVFNLPASAAIARERLKNAGHPDIEVVEGDFFSEPLPRGLLQQGFDRVLFSRVLTDWSPAVCKVLLEKAKSALAPGGRLVINEAFWEGNRDYVVSWEFRYIFYDTFGRVLFKSLRLMRRLLQESGFRVVSEAPMLDQAFYSVIVAEPIN